MLIDAIKKIWRAARPQKTSVQRGPDALSVRDALPARSEATLDRVASYFFPAFWDIDDRDAFSESVKQLTASMPLVSRSYG